MLLDPKDFELIERIVYKNADDIAVSISRSFERLEERIDATESRLYSRLADIENNIDTSRQDIIESINEFKDEIRTFKRVDDSFEAD